MSRDDLLKSIGFGTDFIKCLNEHETMNPEFIRPAIEAISETVSYFDSQEIVISVSPPNYFNKITIGK